MGNATTWDMAGDVNMTDGANNMTHTTTIGTVSNTTLQSWYEPRCATAGLGEADPTTAGPYV